MPEQMQYYLIYNKWSKNRCLSSKTYNLTTFAEKLVINNKSTY